MEMIGALKQRETGRTAANVGRELVVGKYGGPDVNEAQRLRRIEDENQRMKKAGSWWRI